MTCITGLTAQNTLGVKSIYPVSDQSFVEDCLDAVLSDVGVDAIKTGMLSTVSTVQTIVKTLKKLSSTQNLNLVVDPVMVSTSGANLIPLEAIDSYIDELIPLATVFTPNIIETKYILERLATREKVSQKDNNTTSNNDNKQEPISIKSIQDMRDAAKKLHDSLNCKSVLVKGGHIAFNKDLQPSLDKEEERVIVDILYDGKNYIQLQSEYYSTTSTHGTGCTLSAAIASNLAQNKPVVNGVKDAIYYVQQAIKSAFKIGHGFGPVNHMHNIQHRPFAAGKFLDYLMEHPKVKPFWTRYVNHEFTKQLAYNTLPLSSFKYFLEQDYIYLKHYARCYGLSVYKADDMETIKKAAVVIQHISHEMNLHIKYCASFGLSVEELEAGEEGVATYAYSRYLIDIGAKNDWFSLQVALSPCLFGYIEAASNLKQDPKSSRENNPYWRWVENYTAEDFKDAVREGRELLEEHVMKQSVNGIDKLVDIFATATKMECQFWDASLNYKGK